jgi:hypothetical protein
LADFVVIALVRLARQGWRDRRRRSLDEFQPCPLGLVAVGPDGASGIDRMQQASCVAFWRATADEDLTRPDAAWRDRAQRTLCGFFNVKLSVG